MVTGKLLLLLLTLGCIASIPNRRAEFFSSTVTMELLLQTDQAILDRLDLLIAKSEERIQFLKRERDRFHRDVIGAEEDPIEFVSNPIRAFLMTKRLVKDYRNVDKVMREDVGEDLVEGSMVLPTENELQGVAEGISNLQFVYGTSASELARGDVFGRRLGRELSAEECFWIGRSMTNGEKFKHANQWLREALKRLERGGSVGVSRFQILDYYSYGLAVDGKSREALQVIQQMLTMNSTHGGTIRKKKVLEDYLDRNEKKGLRQKEPEGVIVKLYKTLCRGDYERAALEISQLFCRYETSTSPFLRLAPLKQEVVKLDPLIVIYHEAISDREINKLIELAKPRLERSIVGDSSSTVSNYRISQNVWFEDEVHPVVETLTQRTKDMAGGLNENSYESLQVNSYGPGGYYFLHHDFSDAPIPFPGLAIGNRMATLMFYLSDVEQGGSTVFPYLKLAVRPSKGTAIFWYNLHRNGTVDKRTLHAACPVLAGNKWVANKWIHEYHQEFIRPCELDRKK